MSELIVRERFAPTEQHSQFVRDEYERWRRTQSSKVRHCTIGLDACEKTYQAGARIIPMHRCWRCQGGAPSGFGVICGHCDGDGICCASDCDAEPVVGFAETTPCCWVTVWQSKIERT